MSGWQRPLMWWRWPRRWPEVVLAVCTLAIFLGFLGSAELWGKREQRAAAEALDTVRKGHWLVAQIQGRPRLEKPPLPRWITAALLELIGRREEWVVRLPSAMAGFGTVVLVYGLGLSMGGRRLALVSAGVLATMGLFVSELRQAGNDGMLAFFTTLALFAAWQCLGATGARRGRNWALLCHVAIGLGFLCKGPVVMCVVAVTVVPYLMLTDGLRDGLVRLAEPRGLIVLTVLSLGWPLAVALADPNALGVWTTEMGQKTGLVAIGHRDRNILGLELPVMALPWSVLALAGLLLPVSRGRKTALPWRAPTVWFPWFWSAGNLVVLSSWAVAKPNYFVPCLPGLALLAGMAWIRIGRLARHRHGTWRPRLARAALLVQWLLLFSTGPLVVAVARQQLSEASLAWLSALGGVGLVGFGAAFLAWRRRGEAAAMVPIAATVALGVLIGYGALVPAGNAARGHRELARRLGRLIPPKVRTVWFVHEIDEGLWFYLGGHDLAPVPGTQPRYSDSFDKLGRLLDPELKLSRRADRIARASDLQSRLLEGWAHRHGDREPYILMRDTLHDQLAPALQHCLRTLFVEEGQKRTNLVLLQVRQDAEPVAGRPPASARR